MFDGPGHDEDFGAEQITGDPADRYAFRTSPLRGVAVQPAFFHNGCFTRLEDAIRHHLDAVRSARRYDPERAGVDADLTLRLGPIEPVLERLDPRIADPPELTRKEFQDLVAFVRNGLLDPRSLPQNLCALVPESLPSGLPVAVFQGCESPDGLPRPAGGNGPQDPGLALSRAGARVWPNPARGATALQFDVAHRGLVEVQVYDLAGRRVRRLASSVFTAGRHVVPWDGRDDDGRGVSSGVYMVRLHGPEGVATQRVTMVR
jgi:hypothetical protein